MGYSRVVDHNRYEDTDHLYDPLRGVLLHPEKVAAHKQYVQTAANHSMLTHDYAYITPQEAHTLVRPSLFRLKQPISPLTSTWWPPTTSRKSEIADSWQSTPPKPGWEPPLPPSR